MDSFFLATGDILFFIQIFSISALGNIPAGVVHDNMSNFLFT
jgi:hypothetical protein